MENISQERHLGPHIGNGQTFTHISMYQNEEIQKQILAVESFKLFQKQRNEIGLEVAEKVEIMQLIGAVGNFLG